MLCQSNVLEVFVAVSATHDTLLPITAPQAGNFVLRVGFNGTWSEYDLGMVQNGARLVLPKGALNQSYTHELQLIDALTGSVISCYLLRTTPLLRPVLQSTGTGGTTPTDLLIAVNAASSHVARVALEPSKAVTGTVTYSDTTGAGATLSFTARTDATGDVVETEIQDSSMSSLMVDFTLSFSGNTLVFTPTLASGNPASGALRATLTTA